MNDLYPSTPLHYPSELDTHLGLRCDEVSDYMRSGVFPTYDHDGHVYVILEECRAALHEQRLHRTT